MQELIAAYTRTQAIEDGEQVDVSTVASEAGIRFPVFFTRAVYDRYVTVPADAVGQDEAGRLWDIAWMLRHAILQSPSGADRISVSLRVQNDNRRPKLVQLAAVCGPVDIDDSQPAITVMLPEED